MCHVFLQVPHWSGPHQSLCFKPPFQAWIQWIGFSAPATWQASKQQLKCGVMMGNVASASSIKASKHCVAEPLTQKGSCLEITGQLHVKSICHESHVGAELGESGGGQIIHSLDGTNHTTQLHSWCPVSHNTSYHDGTQDSLYSPCGSH